MGTAAEAARGLTWLISAEKFGKVTWASRIDAATGRPAETPGACYEMAPITLYPSSGGAHDWQAMSIRQSAPTRARRFRQDSERACNAAVATCASWSERTPETPIPPTRWPA